MRNLKIPNRFQLFGTRYNIIWDDNRMNDRQSYGLCDYSRSEITLSTKEGAKDLSDDKIMDTYYHEKVHAILDMMGERDLSNDEKFVDVFSKLLRQSDESSEYGENVKTMSDKQEQIRLKLEEKGFKIKTYGATRKERFFETWKQKYGGIEEWCCRTEIEPTHRNDEPTVLRTSSHSQEHVIKMHTEQLEEFLRS